MVFPGNLAVNSGRTVYSTSNKNMTARCLQRRNKRSGQQMGCCLLILNATTGGMMKLLLLQRHTPPEL